MGGRVAFFSIFASGYGKNAYLRPHIITIRKMNETKLFHNLRYVLCVGCLLAGVLTAVGQNMRAVNYDEELVPSYELPDLLTLNDGTRVATVRQWERRRRPELLALLADQEYGRTPHERIKVKHETVAVNPAALGGRATSQQVRFTFSGRGRTVEALLLVYVPNDRQGRVPVIVGYNYNGNQTTTLEEDVLSSPSLRWMDYSETAQARGYQQSRWDYEEAIGRGYAVATMCYNDIYPDKPSLRDESVAALFSDYDAEGVAPDEWQALGVWAWGSSRIADYLVRQSWVDRHGLALLGHSRQGKAALWAGAQDKRFAVVISNDSGCGGAALSKRAFGETVARITHSFPHWFCTNFNAYADREELLPFDQHALISLMAPRHVYVASAEDDAWADSHGEFLATGYADAVYALYGMEGLGTKQMPPVHQPIMHDSGYHIRTGKHDVTAYDWQCYLDFCDRHLKR